MSNYLSRFVSCQQPGYRNTWFFCNYLVEDGAQALEAITFSRRLENGMHLLRGSCGGRKSSDQ